MRRQVRVGGTSAWPENTDVRGLTTTVTAVAGSYHAARCRCRAVQQRRGPLRRCVDAGVRHWLCRRDTVCATARGRGAQRLQWTAARATAVAARERRVWCSDDDDGADVAVHLHQSPVDLRLRRYYSYHENS